MFEVMSVYAYMITEMTDGQSKKEGGNVCTGCGRWLPVILKQVLVYTCARSHTVLLLEISQLLERVLFQLPPSPQQTGVGASIATTSSSSRGMEA